MNGGQKQNRAELNFWVMPNIGFSTKPLLESYVKEFEKRRPNVHVEVTVHPWSLAWNRLLDVIKGRYRGKTPDVIQLGTTWVPTLAYLGALETVPRRGVIAEDDKMSAYIWDPGFQSNSEDELYCVPWFIDVRVLYYRKDVFKLLGLSDDALSDWKGFYRACVEINKLLRKGGPVPRIQAPLAISGQKPEVLMHDLAPWIWASGGDFCSGDLLRASLDQPGTVRGCEFYFDLINQGFMPIINGQERQGNFFSGQYAMQFSGTWPIASTLNSESPLFVPEVAENFGVALYPAGPEGRYTFLGGSNLGVTSMGSHKELAWEFVRFLNEPGRQWHHARSIGALTARLSSMEKLFESFPDVKRVFWDSLGYARRLPRLVELGSVEQVLYRANVRLLSFIRTGDYNHRVLHDELSAANRDIDSVLSLHRYGTRSSRSVA